MTETPAHHTVSTSKGVETRMWFHVIEKSAMTKITPSILTRVEHRRFGHWAPCIICGIRFTECDHTIAETEAVIREVRAMDKDEREAIRQESERRAARDEREVIRKLRARSQW